MAFNVDSGNRKTPEMNVTPLVDVVLVLLIIFMVVTPLLMREFWTHLPKQEKKEVQQSTSKQEPLVMQVLSKDRVFINKTEVPLDQLPEKLKRIFAAKNDHTLFVDIKDDAHYGFAVQAMDRAREGRAVTISLLTKQFKQN
jgi:biopolymer transport protein ExbD/biopolymer transport protein TolR